MGQQPALRREQDDGAIFTPAVGPQSLDGAKQRLRLKHHARAAAERAIVHRPVAVVGGIAQIVQPDISVAAGTGALQEAVIQNAAKELREYGDDVENHVVGAPLVGDLAKGRHEACPYEFNSSKSSGGSIKIIFATVSIRVQISWVSG